MSKQLYEEALADVKKLKEVAEDNAKRALLEAVTPRIKDLIETQLLGEAARDEEGELLLDDMPEESGVYSDETPGYTPSVDVYNSEMPVVSDVGEFSPEPSADEEDFDVAPLKVLGKEDVYELSTESAKALGLLIKESKSKFDKRLRQIARQIHDLAASSKIIKESRGFDELISTLLSEVEDMYTRVQEKLNESPRKTAYESILENYYSTLKQLTEQKMKRIKTLSEADVTLKLTGLPDEVDLDSVGVDLITGEEGEEAGEEEEAGEDLDLGGDEGEEEGGEEEGGEEEGGEDLGLGDEEEDEEEGGEEGKTQSESRILKNSTIVEIDERMLRREIARMKSIREGKDDVQTWGHGPGDVSDEFEDDDLGDPFVDIELREDQAHGQADAHEADGPGMDEDDMVEIVEDDDADSVNQYDEVDAAGMDEDDMVEVVDEAEDTREYHGNVAQDSTGPGAQSQKQSRQPGQTVESLRRKLAAESRLQLEVKKKAKGAKKAANDMQHMAKQNKQLAQKAKQQGRTSQAKGCNQKAEALLHRANQLKEAYVAYAKQFNESVRRTQQLKNMLNEAVRHGRVLNAAPQRSAGETSALRNKLAETNLFNTKLLYANKVLQNESFTRTQKAGIIERLDEARSDREVKLVYESLVRTLNNSSRKTVNESTERSVMGSSSRPMRPASTQNLNEGFETDRWARLAGIVK